MALDIDHFAMMQQAVQNRLVNQRVAKDLLPVSETLVRGDTWRAAIVTVGDKLEEQICLRCGSRHIDDFVSQHIS